MYCEECDYVVVGVVNVIILLIINILICKFKVFLFYGYLWVFDVSVDGYLWGEGCGVIILCWLVDVECDGDLILGVIKGMVIGYNGFSSGFMVLNLKV